MRFDDYERALLALCAWREAQGEGREGMRAVMHVIRNRVNSGNTKEFGEGYAGVICRKWQFTSMTGVGDPMLIRWPRQDEESFLLASQLVDGVLDGTDPDITNGACFYFNPLVANSPTFLAAVKSGRFRLVSTIGRHQFYVDSDASYYKQRATKST